MQFLRPGDELVVTRLDRLGRDTRDMLNLVHEAKQHGAHVTVLDPHVTTRGEMGHIVLTVLGMVAQMERRVVCVKFCNWAATALVMRLFGVRASCAL